MKGGERGKATRGDGRSRRAGVSGKDGHGEEQKTERDGGRQGESDVEGHWRVRDEGESLFICVPITDNTLSADALSDTRLIKEIT